MSNLLNNISNYWNKIQNNLFPALEEILDVKLSKKMKQLIALLDAVHIENYIPSTKGNVGRPPKNRIAVARSFLAKAVFNMPTTAHLVDRLNNDKTLRTICGFESQSQIPVESSFSEAFSLFANLNLPQIAHEFLITKSFDNEIVEYTIKDASAIKGREKAVKKIKKIKIKKAKRAAKGCADLTRIQRQASGKMTIPEMIVDLPTDCNVGMKTSSNGHAYSWVGFKFHISVDDRGVTLAALLTSASLNDSQAAIPLAEITSQRVTSFYDLMDSSYHADGIENHSRSLGHVPIIDKAAKGAIQKYEKEQEKLACKNLRWLPAEKIDTRKELQWKGHFLA